MRINSLTLAALEVAPAYDAIMADPSRAVAVDRVKARLAAAHTKTSAKA